MAVLLVSRSDLGQPAVPARIGGAGAPAGGAIDGDETHATPVVVVAQAQAASRQRITHGGRKRKEGLDPDVGEVPLAVDPWARDGGGR
jgi:hypothetical protein